MDTMQVFLQREDYSPKRNEQYTNTKDKSFVSDSDLKSIFFIDCIWNNAQYVKETCTLGFTLALM